MKRIQFLHSKNNFNDEILNILGDAADIKDGERLPLAVKDMGSCEVYPQTLSHNPNGRFVVVCGDGEYIIYTAMALRNKSFGSAQEFVWAEDSSEYAVRENASTVKLFKNFKEKKSFKPDFGAEAIYGGHFLGVKSPSGLAFYDWESQNLIRRIEITPKQVNLICNFCSIGLRTFNFDGSGRKRNSCIKLCNYNHNIVKET